MNKIISCCGVICSECESYPDNCKGCPEIKGDVHWLAFTGDSICPIYECCINQKQYEHCGKCPDLPCPLYLDGDPTKSAEVNDAILKNQLQQLRLM